MARTRKPYAVKVAEGNRGKRKLVDDDVKPEGDVVKPPDMFDDIAIETWDAIVKRMPEGTYKSVDQTMLRCFCEEVAIYKRASATIFSSNSQLIIINSKGSEQKNPWLDVRDKAINNIQKLGVRLGLDPIARISLILDSSKSKESLDATGEFV
jgi:P27 family predicted phage terminase small subunit